MIDSTNIRIIADNIRHLFKEVDSIEPGTLVEGNPTGSGFNTLLTKIKIGSSKYKLPKDVTANPEGEATEDLTKLQIGSDIFGLGAGVTANPEGEATEKLSKLRVGSDIFSVFSGFNIGASEVDTGITLGNSKIYAIRFADSRSVVNNGWNFTGKTIANIGQILFCFGYDTSSNLTCPMVAYYQDSAGSTGINLLSCRPNAATNITHFIVFYTKSS